MKSAVHGVQRRNSRWGHRLPSPEFSLRASARRANERELPARIRVEEQIPGIGADTRVTKSNDQDKKKEHDEVKPNRREEGRCTASLTRHRTLHCAFRRDGEGEGGASMRVPPASLVSHTDPPQRGLSRRNARILRGELGAPDRLWARRIRPPEAGIECSAVARVRFCCTPSPGAG